jgi:hypothetical protein
MSDSMKFHAPALVLLAAGLLAAGPGLSAKSADEKPSRVRVEFSDPDKFTDFRDSIFGTDKGREALVEQFRDCLNDLGRRYVPESRLLEIRFTDIDLAGEYEPWRGPNFDDVRIVKDLYSPRLRFEFRVLDAASGAVVKAGKENIRDMAFLMNATRLPSHDTIRYEKEMLTDWMRREFKPAK